MDFKLEVVLFFLPPLPPVAELWYFGGKALQAPNSIHILLFQIFFSTDFYLLTSFILRNLPFWIIKYIWTTSCLHEL